MEYEYVLIYPDENERSQLISMLVPARVIITSLNATPEANELEMLPFDSRKNGAQRVMVATY